MRITARRLEDLGRPVQGDRAPTAARDDGERREADHAGDPAQRAGRVDPLLRSGRLARGTPTDLGVPAPSDPHTLGVVVASGAVAVAAALQATAGAGRPRTGAEGAHVAVAWAIERLPTTADATFSPTAPSLGSLQLAAWTWVTHAFSHTAQSAVAGREAMLLATVASVALLWVLARRAGLARWSAAIAVATFALSPLAVELHGGVHMANLAVPWALGAFVAARSPGSRALTAAAGGASLAIAVLTAPVMIGFVPALAWQLWRSTLPSKRRLRLATAGVALAAPIAAAVAFAAGSTSDPVSTLGVLGRLRFVLASSSATVDDADLGVHAARSALDLVALDPVVALAATVAAAAALVAVPRLRPVGCAFMTVAFTALVGTAASTAAIVLLPLGALLIGAAAQSLWVWHTTAKAQQTSGSPTRRASRAVAALDAAAPAALTGLAVAALVALPLWTVTHHRLVSDGTDTPLRQAEAWVTTNVATDQRIIVDDALWVDLVEAGFPGRGLAGYGAVGNEGLGSEGPGADGSPPSGLGGWRSYDYLVSTEAAAVGLGDFDQIDAAVASSAVVATFGDGDDRVEVRRIEPDGPRALRQEREGAVAARAAAGAALARNPAIEATPAAAALMRGGEVDERVLTVLATLAADYRIGIEAFPAVPGERDTALPARRVDVASIDGRPISGDDPAFDELVAFLEGQNPAFRAEETAIVQSDTGQPLLRVTFGLTADAEP